MTQSKNIISALKLEKHPEGGYFKETYRSKGEVSIPGYEGPRNYSTSIYFMLTSDTFSAFHKIKQDEIWHFYKGSPIELHIISEEGDYKMILIGNNLEQGQIPQFVVKGGDFFASRVVPSAEYGLTGCTVSPGFDFRDFDMPSRDALIAMFPEHRSIITELTR